MICGNFGFFSLELGRRLATPRSAPRKLGVPTQNDRLIADMEKAKFMMDQSNDRSSK